MVFITFLFSCKNKEYQKITIYPLKVSKDHSNNSSFFKHYVLYNLPDDFEADTFLVVRHATSQFIDSIIKANPQYFTYQFQFYKKK